MKIGILNFYFANNYGATLQCYALYSVLQKMGNNVVVIDYRFDELLEAYHMPSGAINRIIFNLRHEKKNVLYFLKLINRFIRYYLWYIPNRKLLVKMRHFKRFISKNFSITFQCYRNYTDLVDNPPSCECYIAGSDQIWNIDNLGGKLDKSFFLQFAPCDTQRIIYGASCGKNILPEDYVENILNHCMNIPFISVREKFLYCQLTKKTIHKIYKVCDPVFLLNQDEWDSIRTPIRAKKEKYIVLYILNSISTLQSIIGDLKNHYKNFKIYDISYKKNPICGIDYWDGGCGPDQFLDYIKNAELVVTDSFHGTAFSIIYQKLFISLIRPDTGIRITELLTMLNLTDRIYNFEQTIDHYATAIDYSFAEEKIYEEKKYSLNFLKYALDNPK